MFLQSSLDSMEFPELTTEFQRIKYDKEKAKIALSKGLDKATVKDIFGLSLEEIEKLASEVDSIL